MRVRKYGGWKRKEKKRKNEGSIIKKKKKHKPERIISPCTWTYDIIYIRGYVTTAVTLSVFNTEAAPEPGGVAADKQVVALCVRQRSTATATRRALWRPKLVTGDRTDTRLPSTDAAVSRRRPHRSVRKRFVSSLFFFSSDNIIVFIIFLFSLDSREPRNREWCVFVRSCFVIVFFFFYT